jgi:hypothetical protein
MTQNKDDYAWHWWDYLLCFIAGCFAFLAVFLWNPLWFLGWLACLLLDGLIVFLVTWFNTNRTP